ncbi:MAG: M48 family metalloprotease [Alphaproteobacteria bacterium]|nr:M48 family metalloprotease [Alphaproteobacteria bacterium]
MGNPGSKDTRHRIAHELGHHGRADYVIVSIVSSLSVILLLLVGALVLAGMHSDFRFDNLWGAYAIIAGYAFIGIMGILNRRRMFHWREYMADTVAMSFDPEGYLVFLKSRAIREKYTKARSKMWALNNAITHPTFEDRLDFQQGRHSSKTRPSLLTVLATLFTGIIVCSISLSNYANILNYADWSIPFFKEDLNLFHQLNMTIHSEFALVLVLIVAWLGVSLVAGMMRIKRVEHGMAS